MVHGMEIPIGSKSYEVLKTRNYPFKKTSIKYENIDYELQLVQAVTLLQLQVLHFVFRSYRCFIFAASNLIHEIRYTRYWGTPG